MKSIILIFGILFIIIGTSFYKIYEIEKSTSIKKVEILGEIIDCEAQYRAETKNTKKSDCTVLYSEFDKNHIKFEIVDLKLNSKKL
jgi:hypothetical protein